METPDPASSAKPRVLLVDDEPSFTQLMKANLERISNFAVACVNDSTKVLTICQEWKPDVVVLDEMMPEINGYEIFKTIRNSEVLPNIRIIMLSACYRPHDLENELKGNHDHMKFSKPIKARELVQAITVELERAKKERQTSGPPDSKP
tara:strand:+ start:2660 stop:3106 length:447 start_codon:yes stop_codon:yes gene_type:complete